MRICDTCSLTNFHKLGIIMKTFVSNVWDYGNNTKLQVQEERIGDFMSKKPTKERILESALNLFSEKGYDGVGVDLVAEAAGIKGPSLYRHFKGKEDILNCLMEKVGEYYSANFGSENHPGKIPDSMSELVEVSLQKISFTMHDDTLKKARKLLAMEQFRNKMIAELNSSHQLDGLQQMYQHIFEKMMDKGIMKKGDAKFIAMEYIAPVSLLIHICDRQPEREAEIMEKIEKHLNYFAETFKEE